MKTTIALLGFVLFAAVNGPGQEPSAAQIAEVQKLVAGLNYQSGVISLRNGLARLSLTPAFRYLDAKDAETVLVKLWGNPPAPNKPLGMLVPADGNLLSPTSWAVTINYSEDGYVKDDEAAKINYDKMLKELQEGVREGNKERVAQGYRPIELIGWAAPPHYDQQTHKLHWAKEIKFGSEPENTLNYNIRILGRRGVLVLNAIASIRQLDTIKAATPTVLSMVEFNEGHRYADFDSKTDRVATYGLAALVAGGVAAKMGFFKGIWIALLAAKKFIIIAFIAIAGWISRFFKGRKSSASPTSSSGS